MPRTTQRPPSIPEGWPPPWKAEVTVVDAAWWVRGAIALILLGLLMGAIQTCRVAGEIRALRKAIESDRGDVSPKPPRRGW